jgi:hypothetical protein
MTSIVTRTNQNVTMFRTDPFRSLYEISRFVIFNRPLLGCETT